MRNTVQENSLLAAIDLHRLSTAEQVLSSIGLVLETNLQTGMTTLRLGDLELFSEYTEYLHNTSKARFREVLAKILKDDTGDQDTGAYNFFCQRLDAHLRASAEVSARRRWLPE